MKNSRGDAIGQGDPRVARLRRSLLRPAALLLALLTFQGCSRPSLIGTWVGRDPAGKTVTYTFNSDGTGRHSADALEEPMTYHVREGYPNLIEIRVGQDSAAALQGIVQVLWDGRMRLELSEPGAPPPQQLSKKALVLQQPATK